MRPEKKLSVRREGDSTEAAKQVAALWRAKLRELPREGRAAALLRLYEAEKGHMKEFL